MSDWTRYEPLETYSDALQRVHRATVESDRESSMLRLEYAWAKVEAQRQRRVLEEERDAAAALTRATILVEMIAATIIFGAFLVMSIMILVLDLPIWHLSSLTFLAGMWLYLVHRLPKSGPMQVWRHSREEIQKEMKLSHLLSHKRLLRSTVSSQASLMEKFITDTYCLVAPRRQDPLDRFMRPSDTSRARDLPLVCHSSVAQAIKHAESMERTNAWFAGNEGRHSKRSGHEAHIITAERQIVRIAIDRLRVLDATNLDPHRLPLAQLMTWAREAGAGGLLLPGVEFPETGLLAVLPEAVTGHVRVVAAEEVELPVEVGPVGESRPKWLSDDQMVAAVLGEAMASKDFDSWLDRANPYFGNCSPRAVLDDHDQARFKAIAERQLRHKR